MTSDRTRFGVSLRHVGGAVALLLAAIGPSTALAGAAEGAVQATLSTASATRASAISGPAISIQPLALDFGTVTVGTTESRQYTVRNTGDAPLEIAEVVVSDPAVTTNQPTLMTLDPGGSFVAEAIYTPTAGTLDGTLEVRSDATNGAFRILLGGRANMAPAIDPIVPIAAIAWIPIQFTVHATDRDGDQLFLSAAGLPPGAAFDPLGGTFTWSPTSDDGGVHTVTIRASDGFTTSALPVSITVTVLNHPPVADPGGPYVGRLGQPVQFDGSRSSDPEGRSLVFDWAFGDGAVGAGERPTHVYTNGGTYLVTLQVSDDGTPNLRAVASTSAAIALSTRQITVPASQDNTIFSESDSSYGAGWCLLVGRPRLTRPGLVFIRRVLMQFDLSSIPPGSEVVAARLNLFRWELGGPGNRLRVYRLLEDWGEGNSGVGEDCTPPPRQFGKPPTVGSSNWTYRFFPTAPWQTPGGTFRDAYSDSEIAQPSIPHVGLMSVGITSDVSDWVRDPSSNHGWILLGDETELGTGMRFSSRQDTVAASQPSLTLFFNPPIGACCKPDGTCDVVMRSECTEQSGTYGGDNSTCAEQTCLEPYVDWLSIPSVATPVRGRASGEALYEIAMKEFRQKLHRDLPPTTLWGYNGQYPGPTIEAYRNRPIQVRWINDLRDIETGLPRTNHYFDVDTAIHGPDMAGKTPRTVVHLHGGHVPPQFDGHPESTFVSGTSRLYRYPNDQLPTILWYHDHALGITRYNVMLGLAGFYLIRDKSEQALPLPSGRYEIPLVIQDRSFHADGSLDYPATWTPMFMGDKVLVNGKVWPKLQVDQGKYRFRVLNGSNHRIFTLALSDGRPFQMIGSDGGLLSASVELRKIALAPGERADLVIDFQGSAPGTEVLLRDTLESDQMDTADPAASRIMKFVVGGAPGWTTPLPPALTRVLRIPESESSRTRTFELRFDPILRQFRFGDFGWEDVTDFPVLGSTEIWQFANETPETHPVHMHLVQFQVLDRSSFEVIDGKVVPGPDRRPPNPEEAGWKDTAKVKPHELLRVIATFGPDGYMGNYAVHCHMLEHEDNEMMRQFKVVPPRGPKPTVATARAEPSRLWPPDLSMVPVNVAGVTDASGAPISVHVTGVTQDEPISRRATLDPCVDAKVADGQLYLRRERQDGGNGRAYRVSFTAVGRDGGTEEGTVLVRVPGKAAATLVVDDGQSNNSFDGCADRGGRVSMVAGAQPTFKTSLGLPRIEGARATVEYTLADPGPVTLAVFDVIGRRVASLAEGVQERGVHRASLALRRVAHGIYFVKMRAGGKVLVRRMPVLSRGG